MWWIFTRTFNLFSGNVYDITTTSKYSYIETFLVPTPDVYDLRFRLTQCEDAFSMALSPSLKIEDMSLELSSVMMGDDLEFTLQDVVNGSVLANATIPQVHQCGITLELCISWSDGVFQLGRGKIYNSVMIKHEIEDLKITSMFLKGDGSTRWQFYEEQS